MDKYQDTRVSVIIPTYNAELTLSRCLDSLLNQSFKNIEIIVVDDMSTDNTIELAHHYQLAYPVVSVYLSDKKGMAGGARNIGIRKANGNYISFIDADDWVDTNYLYHMVHALSENQADIAISAVKREWEHRKDSAYRYEYGIGNLISGRYAITLLSNKLDQDVSISSIVCNKLFRTSLLQENSLSFLENSVNEDDVFTFFALRKAKKVAIVGHTNYHQYQRKGSTSRTFSPKAVLDLFQAFLIIRTELVKLDEFESCKADFFSFLEKCLIYLIENIKNSNMTHEEIETALVYIFIESKSVVSTDEIIAHFGSKRLCEFFCY